jgi:hypothetical protein
MIRWKLTFQPGFRMEKIAERTCTPVLKYLILVDVLRLGVPAATENPMAILLHSLSAATIRLARSVYLPGVATSPNGAAQIHE